MFKATKLFDKIFLHRLPKVIDILYQKRKNVNMVVTLLHMAADSLYPFFLGHTIVSQIYSL